MTPTNKDDYYLNTIVEMEEQRDKWKAKWEEVSQELLQRDLDHLKLINRQQEKLEEIAKAYDQLAMEHRLLLAKGVSE